MIVRDRMGAGDASVRDKTIVRKSFDSERGLARLWSGEKSPYHESSSVFRGEDRAFFMH